MNVQEMMGFPSLYDDIKHFLNKYAIIDVNSYSKQNWRQLVFGKTDLENRQYLINWSRKYKKIDTLSLECENYELKDYFNKLNLAESRLKFRQRSNSVYTCRTMFSSDPENIRAKYECFHCPNLDILSHWSHCSEYSKILR